MFFPRSLNLAHKKYLFSFAIYNLVIFLHSLSPRQPPLHLRPLLPGDAKQLQPATHRTGEPKKQSDFPHNKIKFSNFVSRRPLSTCCTWCCPWPSSPPQSCRSGTRPRCCRTSCPSGELARRKCLWPGFAKYLRKLHKWVNFWLLPARDYAHFGIILGNLGDRSI